MQTNVIAGPAVVLSPWLLISRFYTRRPLVSHSDRSPRCLVPWYDSQMVQTIVVILLWGYLLSGVAAWGLFVTGQLLVVLRERGSVFHFLAMCLMSVWCVVLGPFMLWLIIRSMWCGSAGEDYRVAQPK